jgi:demethylmenaquinone methyltransferase/2-methoxy-6-polyprenyl-1,4-benzoquinol methylase
VKEGEVKPYEETGSKKAQVSTMLNNIAPRYDLLNRLLSLGIDRVWRKKAIGLLREQQPKVVLDVATGTGDVALEIAKQLKPDRIVGIDIAVEMLDIGRKKVRHRELADLIELQEGDSENIHFENNTFDAITVAFGVRNFENLQAGLKEMHRVLNEGGQVVILEFSKPRIFPFKQIYHAYFKYMLPLIGKITSRDPRAYRYLYESVQAFPDGPAFLEQMERAGFKEVNQKPLTLGICSIYHGKK